MKTMSLLLSMTLVSLGLLSPHVRAGELQDAVTSGDKQKVGQLLALGTPVNGRYENDDTPLHWAADAGESEMVRLLIEKGADVNRTNKNGWSPLHVATISSFYGYALDVNSGADMEARRFERSFRGERAARGGDRSSLSMAESSEKYIRVVELLLEKGADVNVRTGQDHTPLDLALFFGDAKMASLLVKRGADVKANGESNLRNATLTGKIVLLREMIKKGAAADPRVLERPLLFAAGLGYTDIAGLFIDSGANVKGVEKSRIPLHWAARNGHAETVALLIREGADVNASNENHATPLHLAVGSGNAETVRLLIDKGADVNARDKDTWTPLHWAAAADKHGVAKLLMDKGADVNARDGMGWLPADAAEQNDHTDLAGMIRKHKTASGR